MNVKDILTKYSDKIICLKGNCDSDVDIKASDFPICNNLALICVDGLDIYLTHGNEYNLEKNRKFNRKGILVYGHEHIPYIKKEKDMVYINVGSISIPKENNNSTYMMYENRKFTIYDIEENIFDSINLENISYQKNTIKNYRNYTKYFSKFDNIYIKSQEFKQEFKNKFYENNGVKLDDNDLNKLGSI